MFRLRHRTRQEVGIEASHAHFAKPGFSIDYTNTVQPSPGAMAYALESFGLPPYPPSGPTVATRTPIRPYAQPSYVLQSIPLAGLGGTVAGNLGGQPLFNPYGAGYSGPAPMAFALAPNLVDPTRVEQHTQ